MKIKLEGNIGNNIRQLRKANHLSQEELAQKCNVSRQTISRWESNEVLPDTNNLIILSKLFNVTLDEVVFGKKKKETNKKRLIWEYGLIVVLILSLILNIIFYMQRYKETNDLLSNNLQGEYIYQPEERNYYFILNAHDNNVSFDVYLNDRWSETWSWKGQINFEINFNNLYIYSIELNDETYDIEDEQIQLTYDADKDQILCSFPERLSLGIQSFTMIRK